MTDTPFGTYDPASSMMNAVEAKADERACTCHPDDAPLVCQHLYAASDCQRQARRWQPIGTAPKDGQDVLAFFPDLGTRIAAWVRPDSYHDAHWCANRKWTPFYDPTHWMPLPAPPGKP